MGRNEKSLRDRLAEPSPLGDSDTPGTPGAKSGKSSEPGPSLDLELERIETEGVMKEGFTGQEM